MNKFLFPIIALAAVIAGALLFAKLSAKPVPEYSLYYKQTRVVKPFELINHKNQRFTNQQLDGKWSWVFFGYTSCPDVCPTTLQELNFIYDDLKQVANNTQVLLVSIDPNRDTPDRLAQYIAYFNKEFIALTADHSVLYPFARNMGLMYAINDSSSGEGYLVDHSASMVLINPEGRIAAIFKPKQELGHLPTIEADKLLTDFEKIVGLFND